MPRWLDWGPGTLGVAALGTTTSHLDGSRSCELEAERLRLPYGFSSRVAVVPSPSEKTRGVSRQRSQGSPLPLPSSGAHTPGPGRTGRSQLLAAAAATRRPPLPGGALGAAWLSVGLRAGRDLGLRAPSPTLRTKDQRKMSSGPRGPTAAGLAEHSCRPHLL